MRARGRFIEGMAAPVVSLLSSSGGAALLSPLPSLSLAYTLIHHYHPPEHTCCELALRSPSISRVSPTPQPTPLPTLAAGSWVRLVGWFRGWSIERSSPTAAAARRVTRERFSRSLSLGLPCSAVDGSRLQSRASPCRQHRRKMTSSRRSSATSLTRTPRSRSAGRRSCPTSVRVALRRVASCRVRLLSRMARLDRAASVAVGSVECQAFRVLTRARCVAACALHREGHRRGVEQVLQRELLHDLWRLPRHLLGLRGQLQEGYACHMSVTRWRSSSICRQRVPQLAASARSSTSSSDTHTLRHARTQASTARARSRTSSPSSRTY